MVVFDDLHWAEPGLLDLVEHVADYGRGAPVLLVAMARPEFLEQRPGWAGGKLNATTLLLEPLGEAEATRLLAALAGPVSLPEAAARRIAGAAEGNPLFLEELLAALVEEGRLRRLDGHWAAADLDDLGIPPSIQALLTARLDRLERPSGRCWNGPRSPARCSSRAPWSSCRRRRNARPSRRGSRPWSAGAAPPGAVPPGRRPGVPVPPPAAARRHLRLDPQAGPGRAARAVRRLGRTARRPRLREIEEIVGYHLERPGATGSSWASPTSATSAWPRPRPPGSARPAAGPGRGDLPAASKLLERAVGLLPAGAPGPGRGGRRRPR